MFANLSEYHTIGFCGSRALPDAALPLISSIVREVITTTTARLLVGCSVGVDETVIKPIPPAELHRLTIFAAFGCDGEGAGIYSARSTVDYARTQGATIKWWAGGGRETPLRQRLALRSVELCRSLAAHKPAALICFPASPESKGTLLTIRRAQSSRIDLFVKCVGFSPALLPPLKHIMLLP